MSLELMTRTFEEGTIEQALEDLDRIIRRRFELTKKCMARNVDSIDYPEELVEAHELLVKLPDLLGGSVQDIDADEDPDVAAGGL